MKSTKNEVWGMPMKTGIPVGTAPLKKKKSKPRDLYDRLDRILQISLLKQLLGSETVIALTKKISFVF